MPDTVTFAPNVNPNPVFSGRGSVIQNPDILPIFWGPYWPGTGGMTVATIMGALNSIVAGPYLRGLTQYGFSGTAQVRLPRIDRTSNGITLPAPGPGVNQSATIDSVVASYLDGLLTDNIIENVDDNHELVVVIFLDPSVPNPTNTNAAGQVSRVFGDNGPIEKFEFLDDNTRFQRCWVNTSSQQLTTVTQTMTHELVEAISDPFNSGWHQTAPPPSATAGQIGDVCNQPALVNGVSVTAYWSNADGACIVPTAGSRSVLLSFVQTKHDKVDGPSKQGFVDFGSLCGGARSFDYMERTYVNALKIDAKLTGYEAPIVNWAINGIPVPILGGSIQIPATWEAEPPPAAGAPAPVKPTLATLATFNSGATASEMTINCGPNAGNVSFRVDVSVREAFDAGNGRGSTTRTGVLELDVKNQEIIWGPGYTSAHDNCERVKHLFDGNGVVIGPPQPGDPARLVDRVAEVLRDRSRAREVGLRDVAALVEGSRPELAAALTVVAQRGRT